MDKNDILDYVTETPGNTNRAVLGSMLDSFAGGGGGGGGDSSVFVITTAEDYFDKTWKEIKDAWDSGKLPVVYYDMSYDGYIDKGVDVVSQIYADIENNSYDVYTVNGSHYDTNNENGYPHSR